MKVFLGGTCAETKWRDRLIPLLEENDIDYFNPIVDDWTEECIKNEENEKDNLCDVHLFLITPEMKGVYSIAEMMASATQKDKKTIFVVCGSQQGFGKAQIKSLVATSNLARKYGFDYRHTFMDEWESFDVIIKMIKKEMV